MTERPWDGSPTHAQPFLADECDHFGGPPHPAGDGGDFQFVEEIDGYLIAGSHCQGYHWSTFTGVHVDLLEKGLAPEDLAATTALGANSLTWNEPGVAGSGIDHHEVSRDGVVLDTVTTTSFVDDTVVDGQTYEYRVVAVSSSATGATTPNRSRSSPPPSTTP